MKMILMKTIKKSMKISVLNSTVKSPPVMKPSKSYPPLISVIISPTESPLKMD